MPPNDESRKENHDQPPARGNSRRKGRAALSKGLGMLQTGWSIFGISLLLLLGVELLASRFGHRLMGYHNQEEAEKSDQVVDNKNEPWPVGRVTRTPDRRLQWSPYVYWRSGPYSSQYVNVDTDGLRKTVHVGTLGGSGTREVNIFAMGGSTMYGSEVRDEWTIPSILARLLAEEGIRARVTNFGQEAYVSTQEVITLLRELQQRNMPDLVIFYDGVNDTIATFQNARAGWTQNEIGREAEFRALSDGSLFTFMGLAAKHSAIYRLFRSDPMGLAQRERQPEALRDYTIEFIQKDEFRAEYERRKREIGKELSPEEEQKLIGQMVLDSLAIQSVRQYDTNVGAARALARTFDFDALFYWQPVVFEKESPSDYESESQLKQTNQQFSDFFRFNYLLISRAINGNAPEAEEFPHVRQNVQYMGQLFNAPEWAKQTVYRDFCHLVDRGNEAVAKAMLPDIVRKIRQRQRFNSEN